MSIVSNLIFHNAKHYVTSKFGYRSVLNTSAGKTNPKHKGTDYGTNGKKLPQYAIEDGVVLTATRAADGALYVWVKYPRLGVKLLHYHLDSIKVKKGQKVNENTLLGYTGKTGKSTGIHLHLGVKRLSGGDFIDPEKWAKNEYTAPPKKTTTTTTTSTAATKKIATESAKSKSSSLVGAYKTTANLNVRNGAGTSKKILVTIPKGTEVRNYGYYTSVLGTKWLYIQFTYKGITYTGFASSKYLKK